MLLCLSVCGLNVTHCSSRGYFAGRQSTAAAADAAEPAGRTALCFAECRTALPAVRRPRRF